MNNKYLYFKGKYYDVGTKVLIKTTWDGVQEATFCGWGTYPFRGKCVWEQYCSSNVEKYIIDIIEPIEVAFESIKNENRNCPNDWEIEIGLIWYILIMVIGLIFKDRLMIWVVATAIFFLWKKGFLGGK